VRATEATVPFFLVARFIARAGGWTLGLTVFLMAIAFINLVFTASLFNGIVRGANDQVVNAYVGHVTIGPPSGRPFIENVAHAMAGILRTEGVAGASAQTIVPAAMKYGNVVVAREILAIDPADEQTVTNIATKMVEGTFLAPDDADGIVLGIQVAGGPEVELNGTSFRGARVGETVELAMDGVVRPFTIRGIFRTKFLTTDLRAFITRRAFEEMAPSSRDRATTIIVRRVGSGDERALIDALRRGGTEGIFDTWHDNAGIMKPVTKSFRSIDALLSGVGLLIAAATIFIVVYIDVMNKKRQIGVLRALGIKAWIIRATYVLKATVFACLGLAIGSAIFFAVLVPFFAKHPFALPICDAVLIVDGPDLVVRVLALFAVAALSGLVPALLATRMGIVDAIAQRA
jgi:putative ABC transport system permease protein